MHNIEYKFILSSWISVIRHGSIIPANFTCSMLKADIKRLFPCTFILVWILLSHLLQVWLSGHRLSCHGLGSRTRGSMCGVLSVLLVGHRARYFWETTALLLNYHVLVLPIKNVVVQNTVIASLLFKEILVQVRVLIIRENPDEVSFAFVLQNWFFNHSIVWSFSFSVGFNWEGTFLVVFRRRNTSSNAIQLLL